MLNILVATLGVLAFIVMAHVVLSLGIDKSVVLVPTVGEDEENLEPVFVEWTGDAIVLYPGEERQAFPSETGKSRTWDEFNAQVDAQIAGSAFDDLLREVAREDAERHLIVIARPAGFDSFSLVREYLQAREIPFGYEPLEDSADIRAE